MVDLAQLVRASDCGSEGRGFEPHIPPFISGNSTEFSLILLHIITLVSNFVTNSCAMKIVIAPDSFKGSLSSSEVADAIENGVKQVLPNAEVVKIPLADGGEGTSRLLSKVLGGRMISCVALDPLGREIVAEYCVAGRLAVIETAAASGLMLVEECSRDAMEASSFGTGMLICDALDRGCRDFLICLGGSATTDAGMGMLSAIGVKFYDSDGGELQPSGKNLNRIASVDTKDVDNRLKECRFEAVCDVENVLYGDRGAAYVFAPQKGASLVEVQLLDVGLRNFAMCVNKSLRIDVSGIKGGGAAGGIGASLVAFLGAELRRGIDVVLDAVRFDDMVAEADVVITGEGKADAQTLMGKLPSGVLERSRRAGVPVILLAGKVECRDKLLAEGFRCVESIVPSGMNLATAMRSEVAEKNIENSIATLFGNIDFSAH